MTIVSLVGLSINARLLPVKSFLHSLPYEFSEFRMDKERMQAVPRVFIEEFQRGVPRVDPIGLAIACQRRAVTIFSIILPGSSAEIAIHWDGLVPKSSIEPPSAPISRISSFFTSMGFP